MGIYVRGALQADGTEEEKAEQAGGGTGMEPREGPVD